MDNEFFFYREKQFSIYYFILITYEVCNKKENTVIWMDGWMNVSTVNVIIF